MSIPIQDEPEDVQSGQTINCLPDSLVSSI